MAALASDDDLKGDGLWREEADEEMAWQVAGTHKTVARPWAAMRPMLGTKTTGKRPLSLPADAAGIAEASMLWNTQPGIAEGARLARRGEWLVRVQVHNPAPAETAREAAIVIGKLLVSAVSQITADWLALEGSCCP